MNNTTFKRDETRKTVIVEHEFNASLEKVWAAWTNGDQLEKWWGPKIWPATSKEMDFRIGGHWHYYMTGPDGTKAWGWVDYVNIEAPNSFTAQDAFSDETGNKNPDLPSTNWRVEFVEEGGKTKVQILLSFLTLADMKTITKMGFEEGFSDALDNLDRIFG